MNVWRTLGLERTDDVGAIRRAYARRLKAIDVDAEPAAFIALRGALDAALREVQERAWQAAAPEAEAEAMADLPAGGPLPDAGPVADSAPPQPAPASPAPAPAPADPAPEPDDGARFIALEHLLFGQDGAAPDPDALAAAVRAILDHPDMARIDSSAGIENWLAEALYQAVPRSDPVLPLVVDHFDWEKSLGRWDNPWLVEELVKRRRALDFVAAVSRPGHPLHKAWLDLASHEEELGYVSRRRATGVRTLLERIRHEFPAAEACLWPHRVASWDTQLYSQPDQLERSGNWVWLALVLGIGVVRIFASGSGSHTPAPPPIVPAFSAPGPASAPVASTPQAAMDATILAATMQRYDLDALAGRNPVLHARLMARWEVQREAPVPLPDFQADVEDLLHTAEREALRGGSYRLQHAYWAATRDELASLLNRDVAQCARAALGNWSGVDLSFTYRNRRNGLRAEALGERLPAHVPPAAGSRRFTIPAEAVRYALAHSGLGDDRLSAGWLGRGSERDRCLARIALLDAALALPPRTGGRLLRDLSAGL